MAIISRVPSPFPIPCLQLNKVINCLQDSRRILVTGHTIPDGDALGAVYAFGRLIKKMNPDAKVTCYADTRLPLRYRGLPAPGYSLKLPAANRSDFDAVAVLDCVNLELIPRAVIDVIQALSPETPLIKIDHHQLLRAKLGFGTIFYCDPQAFSTTQLIWQLFEEANEKIDSKIAKWILAGLYTDNIGNIGGFRSEQAGQAFEKLAARFRQFHIDSQEFKASLTTTTKRDQLFLKELASRVETSQDGRLRFVTITKELLYHYSLGIDDERRLASQIRDSLGREGVTPLLNAVFIEANEGTDVRIIGLAPWLRVDELVAGLNGHIVKNYAFLRLTGPIEKTKDIILSLLEEKLPKEPPQSEPLK